MAKAIYLSRVLDFILLFHWRLWDDSYSHPSCPSLHLWNCLPLPIYMPHFPPPPPPLQLQLPALSFPAAMRVVQVMTSPKQCQGPLGEETWKDLLPFFTGANVWISFPLLLGPLLLLGCWVFFVCVFNDKVNTNRKNKAFWLHIMLVVVWHLRAIMGNRDSDRPQTQLCFSGQWSLVELPLQACSGGLDLTWRC